MEFLVSQHNFITNLLLFLDFSQINCCLEDIFFVEDAFEVHSLWCCVSNSFVATKIKF
jgi:hypothetical protein